MAIQPKYWINSQVAAVAIVRSLWITPGHNRIRIPSWFNAWQKQNWPLGLVQDQSRVTILPDKNSPKLKNLEKLSSIVFFFFLIGSTLVFRINIPLLLCPCNVYITHISIWSYQWHSKQKSLRVFFHRGHKMSAFLTRRPRTHSYICSEKKKKNTESYSM